MNPRLWLSIAALVAAVIVTAGVVHGQKDVTVGAGPALRFTEIAREAGVDFRHVNGASPGEASRRNDRVGRTVFRLRQRWVGGHLPG